MSLREDAHVLGSINEDKISQMDGPIFLSDVEEEQRDWELGAKG